MATDDGRLSEKHREREEGRRDADILHNQTPSFDSLIHFGQRHCCLGNEFE